MNWNKVITVIFLLLFVVIGGYAAVFFLEMNRELTLLRGQETAYQQKLADAQARLAAQEKHLAELRGNPRVVEEVIRKKLGYVREQEFIFRFEDNNRLP